MTIWKTFALGSLLAACTAYPKVPPGGGGSDGSGGSGGSGSDGSGSDMEIDAPMQPPGDPIVLAETTVRDERGDQIAFDQNGPLHTHAGAQVSLADPNCADVYKFAYLADAVEPAYGREATRNPIAFAAQVNAQGTLRYRVRGEAGAILDWTAADAAGAVELHRGGAHPALPAAAGKLTVDFDLGGGTPLVSRCFYYHPLAAPAKFEQYAATGKGFPTYTFAAMSPVGDTATKPTLLYKQNVTQYASEPIALDAVLAAPTLALAKTVADRYVNGEQVSLGAGVDCGPRIAAGGSPPPPGTQCSWIPKSVDTATTATNAVTWHLALVDAASGNALAFCPASTTAPTEVHCTLPARAQGAAPGAYQLVAKIDATPMLEPLASTSAWQHFFYTPYDMEFYGSPVASQSQIWCGKSHVSTATQHTICETQIDGYHFTALAAAHGDLGATTLAITNGTDAPAYAASTLFAAPAATWTMGDLALPAPAAAVP